MPQQARVLTTVLFLDIVGSTELAGELGDERWNELLRRFRGSVRRTLRRFEGREVATAGDGFLARFESPASAVRAAGTIASGVRELGVEVRAGVHFGECVLRGTDLTGVAVHTGARVMAAAGPGEVLVTSTVKDLIGGARLSFADRGEHVLKGVPGEWKLFAASAIDTPVGEPLHPDEAARRRQAIAPAPRRRRTALIVGGALMLALTAGAWILFTGDEEPAPRNRTPPSYADSVVRLDPATGEVVEVARGLPPESRGIFTAVAAGQAGVWVVNGTAGTISRVDPQAGELDPPIRLGAVVFALTVTEGTEGAVWVLDSPNDRSPPLFLERIDAATTRVVDRVEIDVARGVLAPTVVLAAGEGAVWALDTTRGVVHKVDPATTEILGSVQVADSAQSALAVGEGGVWVGDGQDSIVYRIDPVSLETVAEIQLVDDPTELAAGGGAVWAVNSLSGTLVGIDPATNDTIGGSIALGGGPAGMAVGDGTVWVTDRSDGQVFRVNVATREVATIELGATPQGVAVTEDAVWVAVRTPIGGS